MGRMACNSYRRKAANQSKDWRIRTNAQLNPICHLLALLGTHHILHVRRIRFKYLNATFKATEKSKIKQTFNKTCNICINVTIGRVRVTIVAVEKR
jgi:hypothetical protein